MLPQNWNVYIFAHYIQDKWIGKNSAMTSRSHTNQPAVQSTITGWLLYTTEE